MYMRCVSPCIGGSLLPPHILYRINQVTIDGCQKLFEASLNRSDYTIAQLVATTPAFQSLAFAAILQVAVAATYVAL